MSTDCARVSPEICNEKESKSPKIDGVIVMHEDMSREDKISLSDYVKEMGRKHPDVSIIRLRRRIWHIAQIPNIVLDVFNQVAIHEFCYILNWVKLGTSYL